MVPGLLIVEAIVVVGGLAIVVVKLRRFIKNRNSKFD